MYTSNIIPVILCGGKGSRLWPISRQSYPKQFLRISKDDKYSLLQQTQLRLKDLKIVTNPILVCNEEYRFIVAEQMREINVTPKAIILEPEAKNTAPAIALAAFKALEDNENESVLLILSADHKINNNIKFTEIIQAGYSAALRNELVTFGIIPRYPETGYGYIESEKPLKNIEGSKIKRFIEKPSKAVAKEFIKDKRFSWNSGIFMFKTKTIFEELQKYSPLILDICKESFDQKINDLDFLRINKEEFKKNKNISIDYAVMEKTQKGFVIPMDIKWSDIGNWKSLWESEEKDVKGTVTIGKVIHENTENCYIRSESRLVVSNGLKNLIIVETGDAVLVSNMEESMNIKSIIKKLEGEKLVEAIMHRKTHRPWGNYLSIGESDSWQVKKIEVNPGASLSLQMHQKRAEHWVVVKGIAKVQINEEDFFLKANESTFVPLGAKHRLSNPSDKPLVLIEIQSGSYLGEDDIIRFSDEYGRKTEN